MAVRDEPGVDHFVSYLGLHIWHEGGQAWGRSMVTDLMWATGTRRPRLGLLFAMADIVAGNPVTGPITPTVDLRLQLLTAAPSTGVVVMETRPLKVGRRLWSGEVLLRGEDSPEVFGRCEFTFLNQPVADPAGTGSPGSHWGEGPAALPAASFDELFRMRFPSAGVVEMDPHEAVRNGVFGTIQGGAQAAMAEIASERLLSTRARYQVCDIQLRYLNPLTTGPAVATAELLDRHEARPVLRVPIVDAGAGGRLVSIANVVCRPDTDA